MLLTKQLMVAIDFHNIFKLIQVLKQLEGE